MDDYETEDEYTEVYWIKFAKIGQAQEAKRQMDGFVFLSNLLEVSYAPQFESILDVHEKIEERRKTILERVLNSDIKNNVTSNKKSTIVPAVSIANVHPSMYQFLPSNTKPVTMVTLSTVASSTPVVDEPPVSKSVQDIRNKLSKTYKEDPNVKRRRI